MKDSPEPWITVRELVFSFPPTNPVRLCLGEWHRTKPSRQPERIFAGRTLGQRIVYRKKFGSPGKIRTCNPSVNSPTTKFNQNLPELVLIEGIQQVAMKRDEPLSPSLITFRSHFATIHRYYFYDFITARGSRLSWPQEAPVQIRAPRPNPSISVDYRARIVALLHRGASCKQ